MQNNKEGVGREIFFAAVIVAAILLIIQLVLAAHTVTVIAPGSNTSSTAFNVTRNQAYTFNFSVNNTDLEGTGNITQVNITLPSVLSGMVFSTGTNRTDVVVSLFSNISAGNASGDSTGINQTLSWYNF